MDGKLDLQEICNVIDKLVEKAVRSLKDELHKNIEFYVKKANDNADRHRTTQNELTRARAKLRSYWNYIQETRPIVEAHKQAQKEGNGGTTSNKGEQLEKKPARVLPQSMAIQKTSTKKPDAPPIRQDSISGQLNSGKNKHEAISLSDDEHEVRANDVDVKREVTPQKDKAPDPFAYPEAPDAADVDPNGNDALPNNRKMSFGDDDMDVYVPPGPAPKSSAPQPPPGFNKRRIPGDDHEFTGFGTPKFEDLERRLTRQREDAQAFWNKKKREMGQGDTPPGYWDVRFPPTPEEDKIRKKNNPFNKRQPDPNQAVIQQTTTAPVPQGAVACQVPAPVPLPVPDVVQPADHEDLYAGGDESTYDPDHSLPG